MKIVMILSALGVGMAASASAKLEPPMKEVQYRGGLVRFSVPETWIEEDEPDGGGMFYEDGTDTGTLRLNVITAESQSALNADEPIKLLKGLRNIDPEKVQLLPNGNAIVTWVSHSSEEGMPITLFWWHVSNLVPPNHVRLAIFSYTVLTSHEQDAKTVAEVGMLQKAIERAEFYPGLGEFSH